MTNNQYIKTSIPDKYATEFINMINKMEEETGNMYELTVKQFGSMSNYNVTLCSFENRNNYVIFDMKDKYKDLEGNYTSIKEIKDKIELFKYPTFENIFIKNKIIESWECPKCNTYGFDEIGMDTNNMCNFVGNLLCQNCEYYNSSIWEGVIIGVQEGKIYAGGGGSISVFTNIGKIKFT